MRAKSLSRVQLLAPHGLWPARLLCPWDSSGRKYWHGLPCSPPGDLLIQGLNPRLLTSLASTGRFFTACASCGAPISIYFLITHWMKTKRFVIAHTLGVSQLVFLTLAGEAYAPVVNPGYGCSLAVSHLFIWGWLARGSPWALHDNWVPHVMPQTPTE